MSTPHLNRECAERDQIIEEAVANNIEKEEIERYSADFERYLSHLPNALPIYQSRHIGIACPHLLALQNTGNVLINDIRVQIVFPEWSFVLEQDDVNGAVWDNAKLPEKPKPKWIRRPSQRTDMLNMIGGLQASSYIPSLSSIGPSVPRKEGWYYIRDNREVMSLRCQKLQTGRR